MGVYFQQLPDKIKPHVEEVTKSSGLPQTEESLERISKAWLEKRKLFDGQIRALRMVEALSLPKESPKGALLLTYSGSLLSLRTAVSGARHIEYASIGLRRNVPAVARGEGVELENDLAVDRAATFARWPVRSSSPLFTIAVCPDEVGLEEQDKRIREATIFLTNGFVKINRTLLGVPQDAPGQFTMKAMADYVAAKNGLTRKQTRQVVDDFLGVVQTGVLLGEKVRLGRLGKVFLRRRGARKARVGRNPATGADITIKASPPALVPKMAFGRTVKERALTLAPPLVEDDGGVADADHVS